MNGSPAVSSGMINLYKEPGMTSFAAVARVRRILGIKKTGHAGTLDPAAEGVLPVLFGKATRAVSWLSEETKTYRAVLQLGIVTDTQDLTGVVTARRPVCCTGEDICRVLHSFAGEQLQIPPMYSAKKVGGRRLYTLAREGAIVERRPAKVTFFEIRLLDIRMPEGRVEFEVTCSKGAYIRTLCADVGEKLGCGGTMAHLIRLRVGGLSAERAVTMDVLEHLAEAGRLKECVLPVDRLFSRLSAWKSTEAADALLIHGVRLDGRNAGQFFRLNEDADPCGKYREAPDGLRFSGSADADHGSATEDLVRMYLSDGRFMGLYRMSASGIPTLAQNFLEVSLPSDSPHMCGRTEHE